MKRRGAHPRVPNASREWNSCFGDAFQPARISSPATQRDFRFCVMEQNFIRQRIYANRLWIDVDDLRPQSRTFRAKAAYCSAERALRYGLLSRAVPLDLSAARRNHEYAWAACCCGKSLYQCYDRTHAQVLRGFDLVSRDNCICAVERPQMHNAIHAADRRNDRLQILLQLRQIGTYLETAVVELFHLRSAVDQYRAIAPLGDSLHEAVSNAV